MQLRGVLTAAFLGVAIAPSALAACNTPSSDSRVIYGVAGQNHPTSLLMCGRIRSPESPTQRAVPATTEVQKEGAQRLTALNPAGVRSERIAILMRELERTKEQLNSLRQSTHGQSIETNDSSRLEADLVALKSELRRLGHNLE